MSNDSKNFTELSRRGFLKSSVAAATVAAAPAVFVSNANAYINAPKGKSVTLGFNVPQSGAYADEGADELRAYRLAVKHLNGEGDGGLMNTMKPMSLTGNGILGKKV
ncbi:MAG: branched-chain amino acid transport system substrate-binding protein, partial [Pseudohongiellaceae bacterium]